MESIKAAQETVQSVVNNISTNTVDATLVKNLEASASEVRKSIEAAGSIAEQVEKVASKDVIAMGQIDKLSNEVVTSIVSVEKIAENAIKDIATDPKIVSSLEAVATDVVNEMKAAEIVAETVAKVAQADAVAVAAATAKANDVINTVTAVETAVSTTLTNAKSSSLEELKSTALNAIDKIQTSEKTVEAVAKAVQKDAENDAIAVEALGKANSGMEDLVKTAEEIIKSNVAVEASTINAVESKAELVAESIKSVELAAAECTDCAIKAVISASETAVPVPVVDESLVSTVEAAFETATSSSVEVAAAVASLFYL